MHDITNFAYVYIYFYLTMLFTAKLQHLPSETTQNQENSQTQQKEFRPRSGPRILQIQRYATIIFSNHSFYSHKKSHRTQSPKSLQKYGALNYQNKQQNK